MAKYGMSMCVLGMAEEFKDDGIAVNALWPKTGKKYKHYYRTGFYLQLLATERDLFIFLFIVN